MEDDDLADQTQRMLDALDVFLGNARLVAKLSSRDLTVIRSDRERVAKVLQAYRAISGYTRRRQHRPNVVPSGPNQGMMVPVVLGAMTRALAIPAAGAGGTVAATTASWEIAMVLGQVLLPIAAAVLISELTGGSLHANLGRKLVDATVELAKDLMSLGTIAAVMAITAEVAATLSIDELLQKLLNAADAVLVSSMTILLAELAKRFPACAANGVFSAFRAAADRFNVMKNRPSPVGRPAGSAWLRAFQEAQNAKFQAWQALLTCIAAHR